MRCTFETSPGAAHPGETVHSRTQVAQAGRSERGKPSGPNEHPACKFPLSAPLNAQVQSIRLDPRRVTPYLTLAHVLPVGGSPALYRRALQLDPTQGDVYLWHGDALHRLRYYKQANTAYRAALALRPGSVRAYLALAEVRLEVRKPDDAYRMAEAASQLQQHSQERGGSSGGGGDGGGSGGGGGGGGGGGKDDDEDDDDGDDGVTSERMRSSMGVGEAEEGQAATLALNLTPTPTPTPTRTLSQSRTRTLNLGTHPNPTLTRRRGSRTR